MQRDEERISRVVEALEESRLDAVVCSFPSNVLLLSGYWPVIGTAIAVVSRAGIVGLIAPSDERDLVEDGWADESRFFESGSIEELRSAAEAVQKPLTDLLRTLQLDRGRLGFESAAVSQPCSYAAMHVYGAEMQRLISKASGASLHPADELLARLRSIPTSAEIGHIRIACRIAERAFRAGRGSVRLGHWENEVAAGFRQPLYSSREELGVSRADGFTFCMSGLNSAEAYGAYARSRDRTILSGDFLLLHCNSYADGYWTDITRTYCLGEPSASQRRMYEAVFDAREAALSVIRPGVQAAAVDRAARNELQRRGFGREFKHSTGHGVGFAAIDHNAPPRLHPRSGDVLESGMVFNVEPAIYIGGTGGLRHCDMVAVTESGVEVLTPFQASLEELALETGLGDAFAAEVP
jgi:Xaa-Pro aminopeptidase